MQERPRILRQQEDKIRIVGEKHHRVKSFVIIGNALVQAASRLTLLEYHILRYSMSAILKEDTELQILRISIKDMAKKIGIIPQNYSHIFQAVKRLYDRSIQMPPEIENNVEYDGEFRWITKLRKPRNLQDAEKGFIDIRFSETISEFLINIKNGNFTEAKTINLFSIRSIYGVRLYEFIMDWSDPYSKDLAESHTICLKEFRKSLALDNYFDLEDLYVNYSNFRRSVLVPAIDEINDKSDIYVFYETILKGCSVSNLKFTFGKKRMKDHSFNNLDDFKETINNRQRLVKENYERSV